MRSSRVIVCILLCLVSVTHSLALGERVQVNVDAAEAEQVLAILAKRSQGKSITDADWHGLFATEPYWRLKIREAAMHRDFTDGDFKKFVLSDALAAQYPALRRTLDAWKTANLRASGLRVLQYLPEQATIHVKVFPEIKPQHNSFVFDTDTDPAIFLYLDPTVSRERFDNTVAHEMHHIGLSSTDALYTQKISTLPAAIQKADQWMGAFGEGLAVLAAAGGPDMPPHQYSPPDVQENWERGMRNFNQDLATLNEFFLQVLDGQLQGEAANQKAYSFFGEIQGPWYTVGYKMATLVEKRYGRAVLIQCMLDRRLLLQRYNSVAEEFNASNSDHLALWSAQVLANERPPESPPMPVP